MSHISGIVERYHQAQSHYSDTPTHLLTVAVEERITDQGMDIHPGDKIRFAVQSSENFLDGEYVNLHTDWEMFSNPWVLAQNTFIAYKFSDLGQAV